MANDIRQYDVIVIGAGPAGYIAAIRCAQLGLRTACVDNGVGKSGESSLGGTFLNSGCIPALALMESAKFYRRVREHAGDHGILLSGVGLDVPRMIQHKDEIVQKLSERIAELFRCNRIHQVHGHGRLLPDRIVEITPIDRAVRAYELAAEHIVLAAGSSSLDLETAPLGEDAIVDSCAAMNFDSVPARLGIIGAGVIGLEHASVWSRLGSNVTLLDAQKDFLSFVDRQIAGEALALYRKNGLEIRSCARVTEARKMAAEVSVVYEDPEGEHRIAVDKLIVAVGRKPNSDGLAAPEADLLLDEHGFVHVDEQHMTNLPGVYAIGDLIQGPMLAHKGAEEGIMVAEIIAGKQPGIRHAFFPNVVYTEPEIAWVGQTEQQLKATGEEIKIGIFPFEANISAQTAGHPEGMVKIISNKQSDRILGVHILGAFAAELIGEAVLAMEFSASTEDLARTIHASPSFSRTLHEAALAMENRAFHVAPVAALKNDS
ncbi:MAG: dihydrolipoyl dehydrogenase [Methylococcaceae bacterium]|nr:dihydrolipoyl dehydrogenase [Methylococcaceae bacterium]MCI0732478.1 dihydrolipoyl dehydrogenase [Methylococcaceae bacterium]